MKNRLCIQSTPDQCATCNWNASSQAALPPVPSAVLPAPSKAVFTDFFDNCRDHYLVAGDQLSGWGTVQAGAQGLITVLQTLFTSFGVPEDISNGGGPEFSATATADFFKRWGVRRGVSTAHFAQAYGRAEVTVKKAKIALWTMSAPLDN